MHFKGATLKTVHREEKSPGIMELTDILCLLISEGILLVCFPQTISIFIH